MSSRDSERTRVALIEATRELLESAGAGSTGLARIGARAGYSRQAIYRHFGSRAGLLKAVLADVDERGDARGAVARILSVEDARDVIPDLVAWWAGHVAGFAGIARSVIGGRATDPELAEAWEDRMDALLGVCRLVVDRCARDGLLREELDPSVAAEMLWGILSIPLWNQLIVERGWTQDEYRERVGAIAQAAVIVTAQSSPS
jgi:AcrR family transcriptional regulator